MNNIAWWNKAQIYAQTQLQAGSQSYLNGNECTECTLESSTGLWPLKGLHKRGKSYVICIINMRKNKVLLNILWRVELIFFWKILRCNQKNSHYLFFFLKLNYIKAPGNKETYELRIQVLPLPPLAKVSATVQVVCTETELYWLGNETKQRLERHHRRKHCSTNMA